MIEQHDPQTTRTVGINAREMTIQRNRVQDTEIRQTKQQQKHRQTLTTWTTPQNWIEPRCS